MKPDGYRLIKHESNEAILDSGAVFYLPFRKMGQGVLGNGEVKNEEFATIAKANVRRQQGTRCARL